MHPEVAKAIDECSKQCNTCKEGGTVKCSTLQCEPQQKVVRVAAAHGERV